MFHVERRRGWGEPSWCPHLFDEAASRCRACRLASSLSHPAMPHAVFHVEREEARMSAARWPYLDAEAGAQFLVGASHVRPLPA